MASDNRTSGSQASRVLRYFPLMAAAFSLCGCTTTTFDEPTYQVQERPFCSPYQTDGSLTPWVQAALRESIGVRLRPDGERYPAQRFTSPRSDNTRSGRIEQRHQIADASAHLLGGWSFIEETSDNIFATVGELTADLERNKTHSQHADVIAALEVLYPSLEVALYPVTLDKATGTRTSERLLKENK